MNKSIIIILSILVSIQFLLFAQEILWKKNYGLNTTDDLGRSVIQTNDNGFAIVGYTNSFGADSFDVWLIKTDENGDTLWTKTYGGNDDDYGYDLKQTDDDGYILAGSTSSFGSGGFDFYVIRTDSLGDTLWTRTFGGVNDDYGRAVDIVKDGGFVIAGEKDAIPQKPDAMIVRVDQSGQMLWEKLYGTTLEDGVYSIIQTNDGGYVLAGYLYLGIGGNVYGWLLKLDVVGDSVWSQLFGSNLQDLFYSVNQTYDGGYIVTGKIRLAEYTDIWLVKTDSLGNEQWSKNYDYDHDIDVGYSVQQIQDGGYIVAGGASPPDIENRGWIIRTNSVGDTLWTKFIPSYTASPIGSSTICYSVVQAGNGDYIVAGHQTQVTFQQQVMLLRISSDIIPVELTSFTATVTQNSVSLNWQTATETNNSGFEIERSEMSNVIGQTDWQVVGFVPGFGTTTEPKSYSFIDENLSSGKYQYRLKQIDFDGTFEYSNTIDVEITSPTEFSLEQNYPNPFNPSTNIKYTIGSRQFVTLKIFNSLGEEIETLVNEIQDAGVHSKLYILHSTLPSGVYYYQLKAGSFFETKKMILMK